jgi:hypothetical protein
MTASELKIMWEWEPAPTVRAPEHRATWALVQIQAGTDYVTLVEDRESGSSRRSIYCPLYPLAEWVVYNWWFLQADARPSGFLSQERGHVNPASRRLPASVRDRHSIRASGDGFAWPDLLIVPDGGGQTRLVWEPDRPRTSNWPIRFLTRGDTRIGSEIVQHELELLVSSVLTRLTEQGVTNTVLAKEWQAIQQTSPEEAEYCLAAARLGLDPYCDSDDYEQEIIQASESLNGDLLTDFLNAVEPSRIKTALSWVLSAWHTVERATRTVQSLAPSTDAIYQMRTAAASAGSLAQLPPWDVGYWQARSIRDQVMPDNKAPFPVEHYVPKLTRADADPSVQALGRGAAQRYPLVVIGRSRPPTASRFTLSRALWHCIWDDSPTFMVTSAHTYPQRVERAFAAELLAPADGIASLLESPPDVATQDELEQIAKHFRVSSLVIDHQVRNRLLAAP